METFKITRDGKGSWFDAETLEAGLGLFFEAFGPGENGLKCEIFWERSYFREYTPSRISEAIEALKKDA